MVKGKTRARGYVKVNKRQAKQGAALKRYAAAHSIELVKIIEVK